MTVDSVDYANEGDWATRTRDSLGGWSWLTPADGTNRSFERRNPTLATTNGQNWGASTTAGGTPGTVNTLRASNIAPVIAGVRHSPAVPTSTDAITITCAIVDETTAPPPTAALHWRVASTSSPGEFQTLAMTGDSAGLFSAVVPPMADGPSSSSTFQLRRHLLPNLARSLQRRANDQRHLPDRQRGRCRTRSRLPSAYVDVTANDNWSTSDNLAAITTLTAGVGAFALVGPVSHHLRHPPTRSWDRS